MTKSVVIVPGGIGGTGGLSIDVANLAGGLFKCGWNVSIAGAESGDPAFAHLRGVQIERLKSQGGRAGPMIGLQTGLAKLLRAKPDAIVHAFGCMPSYLTTAALLTARWNRQPLVWTPMYHPLRTRVWRGRPLLWPMFAFDAIAPLAGRITNAIGAATDDEAGAFRRAHAPLVEMLPPVVEDKPVVAEDSAIAFRASIGVGTAPLILLVASRDEPRKGLDFALTAFELLRRRLPDVRLALIGLGSTRRTLPDGVLMLGRVDDATLARANRAADVVFVPSLFEAFSRVVIEAWQQSTPVVVSDGVALAPVVRRLGGGVVAYGDARAAASELETTLRQPRRAKRQGLAGQQLVRREYVVDVLVDRVVTVYRTILEHRRVDARGR